MRLKDLQNLNIEQVAKAIEADAGQPLEGLRESLAQAKAGVYGRITTPEQIKTRLARTKVGMTQQQFADLIDTPVTTVQGWEQGRFTPPKGVLRLFDLLIKRPDLSSELAATA